MTVKELQGKVAVVTGAASGIGLALCRSFAAEGTKLVMADIEEEALSASSSMISQGGAEVLAVPTDVSVWSSVEELASRSFDRFGEVHVLCNNAGVFSTGRTWEQSLAQWEWVLGVNLMGVVHGLKAFVPRMQQQSEGHVVNTASLAGFLALPLAATYTASKHAVVGISECLHHELVLSGSPIGVSALCPSWVDTNLVAANRNAPRTLQDQPEIDDDGAKAEALAMANGFMTGGMTATYVAAQVLGAVTQGRFWVILPDKVLPAVTRWSSAAVDSRNPDLAEYAEFFEA